MPTDPKLENYLTELDQALGPIPVSDRAEILMEIKGHILDALEAHPEAGLGPILASLGDPQTMANKYLLERGLKPGKRAMGPIVKWLTLGFLGTVGMALLFTSFVLWQFSPLFSIDEKNDRVTILGGLIDIDGKKNSVRIGESRIHGSNQNTKEDTVHGEKSLKTHDAHRIEQVHLRFTNGDFTIETAKDENLHWDCEVRYDEDKDEVVNLIEQGKAITLSFQKYDNADCRILVPSKVKLISKGVNGDMKFHEPDFEVDAELTNGDISFKPRFKTRYHYDNKTRNGRTDRFEDSNAKNALAVKLGLVNGDIILDE